MEIRSKDCRGWHEPIRSNYVRELTTDTVAQWLESVKGIQMSEITQDIEEGCGNVYADIGILEPEMMKRKADWVYEISMIIKQQCLTRENAAKTISLPVSELSELLRGGFRTVDESKLLEYINKLRH